MSADINKRLDRIEAKIDLLLSQKATGQKIKLESVSTHSISSGLSEKEVNALRHRRRTVALKQIL